MIFDSYQTKHSAQNDLKLIANKALNTEWSQTHSKQTHSKQVIRTHITKPQYKFLRTSIDSQSKCNSHGVNPNVIAMNQQSMRFQTESSLSTFNIRLPNQNKQNPEHNFPLIRSLKITQIDLKPNQMRREREREADRERHEEREARRERQTESGTEREGGGERERHGERERAQAPLMEFQERVIRERKRGSRESWVSTAERDTGLGLWYLNFIKGNIDILSFLQLHLQPDASF